LRTSQDPGFRWKRSVADEHVARIALIVLLLPFLFLLTPGHVPHTDKIQHTRVVAPAVQPEFHLEERLAFARGLRDRLVSSAIESDFNGAKASQVEVRNPEPRIVVGDKPSEEKVTADEPTATEPAILSDDRRWSLPFNSQEYASAALPHTSAGSFRAEVSISPLLNASPSVAEIDTPTEQVSIPEKPKAEKRRKVVAQRKRPRAVNQMTAAAAPAAVQQAQPNLPPPPILFFLGAPPPAAPSQPAAAVKQPQPSAASAIQPASPPQNNSWIPDSLYDNVRNRY
jgi:hypothetical protein